MQGRLACLVGIAQLALASGAEAGDVAKGRDIAQKHCARCHVIGAFNPMGGISSTPSFPLLLRAFKDWRLRFETFYARRPHPAFLTIEGSERLRADLPANAHPVTLAANSIEDILAFAEAQRKEQLAGEKVGATKKTVGQPLN